MIPHNMIAPVIMAIVISIGIAGYIGFQQLRGNFHEVLEGELYRSAQPTADDIAFYKEKYGIRTVINLRDETRTDWYNEEKQAIEANNMVLVDFPMSSAEYLSDERASELAQIMRLAPKPILIHCDHGANRTGLASAIYVAEVAERNEFFSEFQLSPVYGHLPFRHIGRYEMYRSWDDYEERLGF